MGGNCLKNCTTRRYMAEEYHTLEKEVTGKLMAVLPHSFVVPIKAYNSKESFGDMDLLISSDRLPQTFVQVIHDVFSPKELIKNGNVISFEYKEFQIDAIITPCKEMRSSIFYFAYNDLGNLVGRVAHSMGLKLGHDGLSYNWRVDTYQFKNIVLATDWKVILPLLGYEWERYVAEFETKEDIFKFVVSSPYFNKDIFYLHNRNHTSRVRDAKRPTYMEFLKWLETYEETGIQKVNKNMTKENYLHQVLFTEIPGFEELWITVQEEWEDQKEYKRKFNGHLVREWTGLDGNELGKFMREYLEYHGKSMKEFVLEEDEDIIKQDVLEFFLK